MERDSFGRFIKGHKGYKTFKKNSKYHCHNGLVWHLKSVRHNGIHRTKFYKKKISLTVSKLWNNKDYKRKHLGINNPNWNGGKMNNYETFSRRFRAKLRIWAKKIKARDKLCVFCGNKNKLQADHIKPIALYPELAFRLNNGRALCFKCHLKTETYGRKFKLN